MSLVRVCFTLQIKAGRIEEYKHRHAAVWPEMLAALKSAGWHNYSLFLRPDGLLVGYFETTSVHQAQARMAATEINTRWQGEMAGFFEGLNEAPDQGFEQLSEVFNLEYQLAALAPALNHFTILGD